MKNQQAIGDDALMVNTADSVARINSNNGMNCVVNNCEGNKDGVVCTHLLSQGYVGYFDHGSNTIVGIKPYGYNEYTEMKADGVTYYGAVNSMVIQVIAKEGKMALSWVPGRVD